MNCRVQNEALLSGFWLLSRFYPFAAHRHVPNEPVNLENIPILFTGKNMASISVSIDITAPVEKVWLLAGDFNGLPSWLKLIRSSRLSDAGRVRHLVAINGAIIVERLLDHDEDGKQYHYTILEGPDPVSDYVASISLRHIDAQTTSVTWASRFEPNEPDQADAVVAHYRALYQAGLESLKAALEG